MGLTNTATESLRLPRKGVLSIDWGLDLLRGRYSTFTIDPPQLNYDDFDAFDGIYSTVVRTWTRPKYPSTPILLLSVPNRRRGSPVVQKPAGGGRSRLCLNTRTTGNLPCALSTGMGRNDQSKLNSLRMNRLVSLERNLGYPSVFKIALGGRDTINMSDSDPPTSGSPHSPLLEKRSSCHGSFK